VTFRVSRIRSDITFATRRERDFRVPKDFDPTVFRGRPPWQIGTRTGEARIAVKPDTAWWVERSFQDHGRIEDGVFVTDYAELTLLSSWVLRQNGRAVPLEPPELVADVGDSLRRIVEAHRGEAPEPAPPVQAEDGVPVPERVSSPVPPERFAVLQALLAYLLGRCGDAQATVIAAADIVERFHLPPEELDAHLQLLNLVNFGGGCYAVYAELEDDRVRVQKELFGDTFRRPPRLTPLEARAIRLALDFVGPMIAAEADTPLERVRRKLEETFGQFELGETPEPPQLTEEEELIRTIRGAISERELVKIEYLSVGGDSTSPRLVEPYVIERALPHWYFHTWDRSSDAERSFRIDRMRSATPTGDRFEPREGFEPGRLRHARIARVWHSPQTARWRVERGAQPLADGAAIEELAVGSPEWLVGEVLSFRGEGVVLEPRDLRALVAKRARELEKELARKAAKSR
jgi:proteasome accessory factor C